MRWNNMPPLRIGDLQAQVPIIQEGWASVYHGPAWPLPWPMLAA